MKRAVLSPSAGKDGNRAEEFMSLSFSPSLICKQHYLSLMHYQETEREKKCIVLKT